MNKVRVNRRFIYGAAVAISFTPLFYGRVSAAGGLSVKECMELAVKNNLTVKLAAAESEEAKASVMKAAALLLPQIEANIDEGRTFRKSLASSGSDRFIGPFNVFDARVSLTYEIFNEGSDKKLKSEQANGQVSELREELAEEQVTGAAALAYVEVLRASAASTLLPRTNVWQPNYFL